MKRNADARRSVGVIYQLMPDRFARHEGWRPEFANLEVGSMPGTTGTGGQEFFGGTLLGVAERLDHIRSLGAETILLTPILSAPSYHRYDSVDMRGLDPRLGTWKHLAHLIAETHKRGMKILCDLPFNHISSDHPWFREAMEVPHSPKRAWFTFLENGSHLGWWGNSHFPELNLGLREVQDELWRGEESVLAHWLGLGFDGVRLDCANDLTLPVCHSIARAMHARFPEAILMGEVFNFATPWAEALTLTQSYWFTANVKSVRAGSISPRHFLDNMARSYKEGGAGQLQILSSHDIERSDTHFAGAAPFHRAARRLQFLLPGVPMLYAGEEFAMKGGGDPLNRAPIPWHKSESAAVKRRREELTSLAELRRSHPELARGHFLPLPVDLSPEVVSFLSYLEDEPWRFSLVTWNASPKPCKAVLSVPYAHLYSETRLRESFTGRELITSTGFLGVELAPWECAHWTLHEGNKGAYRFFKRWKVDD